MGRANRCEVTTRQAAAKSKSRNGLKAKSEQFHNHQYRRTGKSFKKGGGKHHQVKHNGTSPETGKKNSEGGVTW